MILRKDTRTWRAGTIGATPSVGGAQGCTARRMITIKGTATSRELTRLQQESLNKIVICKFVPHNLVQTLLLESRQLSVGRRPLDCDHSSIYDRSRKSPLRTSNTRRRPYGSSPPGFGPLPQHQGEFLTKAINAVLANPQLGMIPDYICCKAMGLRAELRKHFFADCKFAKDNALCHQAFENMCSLLNSLSKKVPMSDDTSKANCDLAINRLETILDSPDDQLEEDDIESDDEASTGSNPDFTSGDVPVHGSLSH